jgi:hypothetical protein
MRRSMAILAVLCGGLGLSMTSPARAQNWNAYNSAAIQNRYSSAYYTTSAVSPYLNLGVNPNGLSTYQTLVKPMLDEREALSRQSVNLPQLRQQMTESRDWQDSAEADRRNSRGQPQPAVRRMYYSHFYNKLP